MNARLNWLLATANDCLANGGVIAYPTETVYGLGCNPLNRLAVERLLTLKQRSVKQGLIILAADLNQLSHYLQPLTQAQQTTLTQPVERTTTWLVPAQAYVPDWLTGDHRSLAIRITQHPLARALCQQFGALVSTSANCSRQPAAHTALQVRTRFNSARAVAQPDLIIHGHCGTDKRPSQIIDLLSGKILRH